MIRNGSGLTSTYFNGCWALFNGTIAPELPFCARKIPFSANDANGRRGEGEAHLRRGVSIFRSVKAVCVCVQIRTGKGIFSAHVRLVRNIGCDVTTIGHFPGSHPPSSAGFGGVVRSTEGSRPLRRLGAAREPGSYCRCRMPHRRWIHRYDVCCRSFRCFLESF